VKAWADENGCVMTKTKGATMKRSALLVAVLSVLAARAEAQNPAAPAPAESPYAAATFPAGASHARLALGSQMVHGDSRAAAGACDSCGSEHARGDKLQRLFDFLLYRPTIPCASRFEPTGYQPPLTAGFPTTCSGAAGGCGCDSGKPLKLRQRGSDCTSCAASLGKPTKLGRATDRQASPPPMIVMPKIPATSSGIHTTLGRPQMPLDIGAATPYALPTSVQQPAPNTALQSPYGGLPGGYRVQPSSFYLPERP
jgi:hypothetical protein